MHHWHVLEAIVVCVAAFLLTMSFLYKPARKIKFSWAHLVRRGATFEQTSTTQLRIEAAFVLLLGILVWWFFGRP